MTFDSGHDFFSELEPYGIVDPVRVWPMEQRAPAEHSFLKAAREAWQELGVPFMATWKPTHETDRCWALEQFGDPSAGPLKNPRKLRR
jgi:hypothetical protein